VNRLHKWYCGSSQWRKHLQDGILPRVLKGVALSGNVLEIGPGLGIATEQLAAGGTPVTVVELDPALAQRLRHRFAPSRVRVVQGDGTALPFADGSIDIVVCTTMLHHIPASSLQDALFAEVRRVLRPGGTFTGSDSVSSLLFRLAHIGDDMTLVDAAALPQRLEAAGFTEVDVWTHPAVFTFRGRAAA
jgi:SAM-dependent methyltransferase